MPSRNGPISRNKEAQQTYRIVKEWSVEYADYTYAVYVTRSWADGETTEQRFTGDREWAEKNAQHLGVEIVDA